MNIIVVLLSILFILMVCIGKKRGFEAFCSVFLNFFIFFIMVYLICWRVNIIYVTIFTVLLICSVTIFYLNGKSRKTIAAFISVAAVITDIIIIAYKIGLKSNIQGFSNEEVQMTSTGMSMNVNINFHYIVLCCITIGVLGAVIDVAISIASAMDEVFNENNMITKKALFSSGMSIGRDVLGAMINTMLFAYIGGFMTLIIYFHEYNYKFSQIINSKIFC